MARADFRFSYRKRVRYSEIDAQAVLFNARFLDYLDIAVTEYFRAVSGWSPGGEGVEWHVARTAIDYKKPVRLDEELDLCIRCARIGNSSFTFAYEFHGRDADDLRAAGETVAVHIDANSRPQRLPDAVVAAFDAYEGRSLRG